jgi:hypothetical protein
MGTPTTTTTTPRTFNKDDLSHGECEAPTFYTFFAYFSLIGASILSAILNLFNLLMGNGFMPYTPKGYAPIIDETPAFFRRYLYGRISDCFNRPIASKPGAFIDVMDRDGSDFTCDLAVSGTTTRMLNLGSYNYLGFADGKCTPDCIQTLQKYGTSTTCTRLSAGLFFSMSHSPYTHNIYKHFAFTKDFVFSSSYTLFLCDLFSNN